MLVSTVRVKVLRKEISKRRLESLESKKHMGIITHVNKLPTFSDMLVVGMKSKTRLSLVTQEDSSDG